MEAQEYEKLVKALRCCSKDKCGQCEYEWNQNREFCMNSMCADAAAAIEELEKERDYYKQQYENRQRLIKSALGEEWT